MCSEHGKLQKQVCFIYRKNLLCLTVGKIIVLFIQCLLNVIINGQGRIELSWLCK